MIDNLERMVMAPGARKPQLHSECGDIKLAGWIQGQSNTMRLSRRTHFHFPTPFSNLNGLVTFTVKDRWGTGPHHGLRESGEWNRPHLRSLLFARLPARVRSSTSLYSLGYISYKSSRGIPVALSRISRSTPDSRRFDHPSGAYRAC